MKTTTKKKHPKKKITQAATPAPTPRRFWVVMKANNWSGLTVGGIHMGAPKDGPQHFMPMFDTFEQAVKWNGGSHDHIRLAETLTP